MTLDTRQAEGALLAVATATAGEDIALLWQAVSEALDGIVLAAYAAAPLATMTEIERAAYATRLQAWHIATMRSFREKIGR